MTEPSTAADTQSFGSRLRERLGSVSPYSLAMLGLLGFLGDLFPLLEILKLFKVLFLFAFWPFVSMLVGSVRQSLGSDEADGEPGPRDWIESDDGWRGHAAFLLGIPLSFLNPLAFRQDATQLLGGVVAIARNRGSLPDPETHSQSVDYRLPVEGTWTVVNGSPIKEYSHSWFPATQRYAYDFVITDEDGRSRPDGTDTSVENYYCYDEPVLAPADGVVVDVHDGDPELGRGGGFSHPFKRSFTGNAVTIRHADGEYSSLVHLVPGSIAVEPGERVARGQQVGRCGHSGNSAEPHLHFQVQDHPTFEFAAGLPVRFGDVTVDTPGIDVAEASDWDEPDGGPGRYVHVGQRVAHAPDAERSGTHDTDEEQAASATRTHDVNGTPTATATRGLDGVRAIGQVAKGLSIGGFVAVLAGFVVSSVSTVALGLAALAALALVSEVARKLLGGDGVRLRSLGTIGGLGLSAALIGAFATSTVLPTVAPGALGGAAFVTGFLLYLAVWEVGRRSLFRDPVPASATAD